MDVIPIEKMSVFPAAVCHVSTAMLLLPGLRALVQTYCDQRRSRVQVVGEQASRLKGCSGRRGWQDAAV